MREPREYEAPLCAEVGGEHWFPEKDDDSRSSTNNLLFAKRICNRCTHRLECAEWGIQNERHGIWGGLSETQRREIRRKRNIILKEERSA